MSDDFSTKGGAGDELRLHSREYAQVVAPVLQAAAEVAAERGDPQLFGDMASMLALMHLVEGLAERCRNASGDALESSGEALAAAPLGACALVFSESGLESAAVDECLGALRRAGDMLRADGVLAFDTKASGAIWRKLADGAREEAVAALREVARDLTARIDAWEAGRRTQGSVDQGQDGH
jgi:hypothetical protein